MDAVGRKGGKRNSRGDPSAIPGFFYDPVKKRYFKIGDELPPSPPAPELPPTRGEPFATIALLREHGLLQRPYAAAATECRMRGLSRRSRFEFPGEGLSGACIALLSDPGTNCVSSVWTWRCSRNLVTISSVALRPSVRGSADGPLLRPERYDQRALLDTSKCYRPSDTCMVVGQDGHFRVLTCFVAHESHARMLERVDGRNRIMSYDLGRDAVFACAFSHAAHRAAFGTESGSRVYSWRDFIKRETASCADLANLPGIFSVAFGSSGNLLYSGSKNGIVYCNDLRCPSARECSFQLSLGPRALRCLRVLEYGSPRLVCSGDGNLLVCMDLRARRPLFPYEGHVNKYMKLPLSLDEELGVLCSPGQDNCVRLWSLDTGRLIRTIYPLPAQKNSDPPQAVFKGSWGPNEALPAVIIADSDSEPASASVFYV